MSNLSCDIDGGSWHHEQFFLGKTLSSEHVLLVLSTFS